METPNPFADETDYPPLDLERMDDGDGLEDDVEDMKVLSVFTMEQK